MLLFAVAVECEIVVNQPMLFAKTATTTTAKDVAQPDTELLGGETIRSQD